LLLMLFMTGVLFFFYPFKAVDLSQQDCVVYSKNTVFLSACFSKNRDQVFILTEEGSIEGISLLNGHTINSVALPVSDINSLCLSADEKHFFVTRATGGLGKLVRKTNEFKSLLTGQKIILFPTPTKSGAYIGNSVEEWFDVKHSKLTEHQLSSIENGDISNSERYIALSLYSTLLLLSVNDRHELAIYSACKAPFVFSLDSTILASNRHDFGLSLIDLLNPNSERIVTLPERGAIINMTFSTDSNILYCATVRHVWKSATILGIDVNTGQVIHTIEHVGRQIIGMTYSNGNIIVVDRDGRVLKYSSQWKGKGVGSLLS
jgi:hypothetical protein